MLVGIVLFALVLYYVNPIEILRTLQKNLTTPQGVLFAFLASLSFILAFCFRALRWRLFLNPVRQISQVKIIQVFLVGVFLNFVLPIRIGELAKCLILKRTDRIDVRQSLPTITMDKIQDLLPALLIVALAPLLGEQFDAKLWTMLFFAVSVLLGAILFVALTAWKRTFALGLLHKLSSLLPGKIGTKVESFATGFVESLLACTRQPRIFLVAILLTAVSVSLDGLYNMFGFWTIGYHITFGQAVLGYMLFNLFYILPNPPGQVGSNEFVGLLIFSGILHIPPQIVLAEIVLFHAWSALLMCLMGMGSLSALGVSLSHAMKLHEEEPHP
ncbi:membrane protein [Reticulibacter mediterranei]|uniref:Membrane protein n=1 Tax=Reticulibacter mediterranei TaxID=2778369 RepID=A0A8J3INJ6_9CHLR|nr:membrane protein [Reticulibacter mediterranei]